ncbi:MAG: 2-C-methyl-D-erythritol 4-phosphate cytidylyltransferase [Chitinophagaceae bacterium]
MFKYAIIVAGGTGTRMGNSVPKQFLTLKGKPVLYYTLKAFFNACNDLQVILVLPKEFLKAGQEIITAYFNTEKIQFTIGGETRFHSVKNGLQFVKEESIVFVHDAARCLPTSELINRCYETALEKGSAIPVVTAKDSVRLLMGKGTDSEPLDRNKVLLVQTPQCFRSGILLLAFEVDYKEHFTDEATVVEASGVKVSLVDGEENNIKITKPSDLAIAERLLEK